MNNRKPSASRQLMTLAALGATWAAIKIWGKKYHATGMQDSAGYRIHPKRALWLSALLLGADLIAIPTILRAKPDIDPDELTTLNASQVPGYDRIALRQHAALRESVRKRSDGLLRIIVALPLLALFDKTLRRQAGSWMSMYAALHAVTYTIYSFSPLGPAFNDKYRPVVYYKGIPGKERMWGNNRNAHYSGHTGNAAFASFFMATICRSYHPELPAANAALLYAAAAVPPSLLGWMRVRALKHFPSDVAFATAIGAACGILLPELYRRSAG